MNYAIEIAMLGDLATHGYWGSYEELEKCVLAGQPL
jgi:hypothetical protein